MTGVDAPAADGHDEMTPVVSVVRTSPDRTVFTEDENPDGWIATDHTVGVTR